MHNRDPWWWPAVGVALGFVLWLTTACIWVAVMSILYGIYVWFGGKVLLACILAAIAVILHFQAKDIDEGLQGNILQNMAVRVLRRLNRRDD